MSEKKPPVPVKRSGVMVVAKHDVAHAHLAAQFAAHGQDGRLQRHYQVLVWGKPLPPVGAVDAALARSPRNRTKIAVSKSKAARRAVTHYKVLTADAQISFLQCTLETGRTHQIRVHLAHIGHPVLGDNLYGAGMKSRTKNLTEAQRAALATLGRQALHAAALGFEHPNGEKMFFESPPPRPMQKLIETLAE